jgi:hypothetical protein
MVYIGITKIGIKPGLRENKENNRIKSFKERDIPMAYEEGVSENIDEVISSFTSRSS